MKKGFTLIELLAVIIVLSIIMIITIPNVLSTMDKAKDKALETYLLKILKHGREYVVLHQNEFTGPDKNARDKYKGLKYIRFVGNKAFETLTGESSKYYGMAFFYENDDTYIAISDKEYKRCVCNSTGEILHYYGDACLYFKELEKEIG